jgi:hypothetical protein
MVVVSLCRSLQEPHALQVGKPRSDGPEAGRSGGWLPRSKVCDNMGSVSLESKT